MASSCRLPVYICVLWISCMITIDCINGANDGYDRLIRKEKRSEIESRQNQMIHQLNGHQQLNSAKIDNNYNVLQNDDNEFEMRLSAKRSEIQSRQNKIREQLNSAQIDSNYDILQNNDDMDYDNDDFEMRLREIGRKIDNEKEFDEKQENGVYSGKLMTDDEFYEYMDNIEMNGDTDWYTDRQSNKDQLTAFLLTFFLGSWGAGRFYIEDYVSGSVKLVFFVLFICSLGPCCIFIMMDLEHCNRTGRYEFSGKGMLSCAVSSCLGIILVIWILADMVLFGINDVEDGGGHYLIPW